MALLVGLPPGGKREVRQLVAVYPAGLAPIVPIVRRWGGDHLHRAPEAMTLYVQNSLLYALSIAPGKQGHFPARRSFAPPALLTSTLIILTYENGYKFYRSTNFASTAPQLPSISSSLCRVFSE
jgi:hypothetical protein